MLDDSITMPTAVAISRYVSETIPRWVEFSWNQGQHPVWHLSPVRAVMVFHSHLLKRNSPCVTKQGAWEAIRCETYPHSPTPSCFYYECYCTVLFFVCFFFLVGLFIFLLMGTACEALMIVKVVSNIYWEFFMCLIKARAFKPYKSLPCQILLVLLFCRWRNLEFERLINKSQILQLGRAEPRHKPWSVQQPSQGFLWLVVLPLWFVC